MKKYLLIVICLLIISVVSTTAIITGIKWWKGKDKLDKILEEIRARKTIREYMTKTHNYGIG